MNTPQTTTIPATRHASTIQRLHQVTEAWRTYAPQSKFAKKTLDEFISATDASWRRRSELDTLKLAIKGLVAIRSQADKATAAVLNRVIAGVKADSNFGPASPLYRSMGFIPLQERKRPSRPNPQAAPKKPARSSPHMLQRLEAVLDAWAEIAPGSPLANMSLEEFKAAVAPSQETREALRLAKANYSAGIAARYAADEATSQLIRRVINCVKGDDEFGDDCPLYRALGYIPATERRTGRGRAAASAPNQAH